MARTLVMALAVLLAGCASPVAAPEEPGPATHAPTATAEPTQPPRTPRLWLSQVASLPVGIHDVHVAVNGTATTARVGIPVGEPETVVVLAKGLMGGVEQMDPYLLAFTRMGHAAVAVEYRGEAGTWKVANGSDDLAAAAHQMRTAYPDARIVAFGFSMGAEIAALAAARAPAATFDHLVLAGTVSDLEQLWRTQVSWRDLFESETGGRPTDVPRAYASRSPIDQIEALQAAGLTRVHLVHAVADTLVPSSHSERLFDALRDSGIGVSYHEVLGNRDAWVCTPVLVTCAGGLPAGPANHETSVLGPVEPLLMEVVGGEWDDVEGPRRYAVDGVTGASVRLPSR